MSDQTNYISKHTGVDIDEAVYLSHNLNEKLYGKNSNISDSIFDDADTNIGDIGNLKSDVEKLKSTVSSLDDTYAKDSDIRSLATTVDDINSTLSDRINSLSGSDDDNQNSNSIQGAKKYTDAKIDVLDANYKLADKNLNERIDTLKTNVDNLQIISEDSMHFKGTTTTELFVGSSLKVISIEGNEYTAQSGDVVVYDNNKFLYDGQQWNSLGNNIVGEDMPAININVDGTTILQDENGQISAVIATETSHGIIRPDNDTISINSEGIISANPYLTVIDEEEEFEEITVPEVLQNIEGTSTEDTVSQAVLKANFDKYNNRINTLDNVLQNILTAIQNSTSSSNTIADIEQIIVSYLETKAAGEVES